jgi:ParB family chromosome partitioning protein
MQKGLGKGLEALIPTIGAEPAAAKGEEIQKIRIDKVRPNRYQSRDDFDVEKLKELAESIKEKGVIQPLLVTQSPIPGEFELIAGERRLRAAQMADLTEIPAIIKQVTNKEKYQISLIENIQRDNLNPVEEAKAFKGIMKEFSITQEELSKLIGKDRSVVANTLRLLNLPEQIQCLVISGAISAGHARALAGINSEKKQSELAERIKNEKLTVREVERIAQDWKTGATESKSVKKKKPAEVFAMEHNLQKALGTKVEIVTGRGMKKGKIILYYYSLEDFDRLVSCLRRGVKK